MKLLSYIPEITKVISEITKVKHIFLKRTYGMPNKDFLAQFFE